MSDIFRDMQAKIGCQYISDLPDHKRAVWFELRRMPLSDYEEKSWRILPGMYGGWYSILKDVMAHLKKHFATR